MSGIYIECDICGELYGSDSTGYLTDTWIRDGHECVTHCKDCNPHATEHEALRERIAQAIYKATGEGTLITTMDAIMDVIAKASKEARCEHSACSQNYIDTGNTACIKGGDDE